MKTKFFKDVRSPVYAGGKFLYSNKGIGEYKINLVGYSIIRLYFDRVQKDCLVSQVKLKTIGV